MCCISRSNHSELPNRSRLFLRLNSGRRSNLEDKLKLLAKNIKPNITNEVVNDKLVITLSGSVGKPYWFEDEEDYINEKHVKSLINDTDKDIVIKLNSPGGDVFEGIAVYNYLKGLENHVAIEVTALAASAASIIAMAGDELVMCTGSQLMVHEASTITWGNKADHYKTINALETIDNSLVSVYADKTGVDREVITEWLNGETWFTAEEAVEQGLANGIKSTDKEPVVNAKASIAIDTDDLVAKVVAKLNENNVANEKPKTGLTKLFKGAK